LCSFENRYSDDELHVGNIGASTFDGEGTPTCRVPLIVDGVLTNFLHSPVTAKRLNAKPTGNRFCRKCCLATFSTKFLFLNWRYFIATTLTLIGVLQIAFCFV